MNASELLIECLTKEGIEVIAGVSGRPILSLIQAMERFKIKHIQTRHEQGAGFLADGYARTRGKPGVVLIQRGPGATNCTTPIANAMIDGIPLIVLIGQGEMEKFDKGALQELDHKLFLSYFAKWMFTLHDVDRIPEMVRRAFRIAVSGKPGPVILELPMNLMEESVQMKNYSYREGGKKIPVLGEPRLIEDAVSLLNEARFPLVYAGGGVVRSEASQELVHFAETLGIPVMTSLAGKSCFPEDHPLCLGIGGFPMATYTTKQAAYFIKKTDVVLALGSSFREHATRYFLEQPEKVKLIQVDISESELSKNYAADINILGNIKSVIMQMNQAVGRLVSQERIKTLSERNERFCREIEKLRKEWLTEWRPHLESDEVPIDPYRITAELMKTVDLDNSIILHDAGLVRAYICHHLSTRTPGSFVGYGGFSAMGYSLPASLGAKLAFPEKNVFTIIGDGSFGMTGFEIETAVRHGINTITLLYNNLGLDAIRQLQDKRKEQPIWDNLGGSYAEIAHGMGAYAVKVEKPEEISPALRDAVKRDKPVLLEFMVKEKVPTPKYS